MKATYPIAITRANLAVLLPRTPERFSRSLGERNACTRSSAAQIVPMPDPPLHPADRIVLWACAFGAAALAVLGLAGALP